MLARANRLINHEHVRNGALDLDAPGIVWAEGYNSVVRKI
jgi:hypothetical protein